MGGKIRVEHQDHTPITSQRVKTAKQTKTQGCEK